MSEQQIYGVVLAIVLGVLAFCLKEDDYDRDDRWDVNPRRTRLGFWHNERIRGADGFASDSAGGHMDIGLKTCKECGKQFEQDKSKEDKPLAFCSDACENEYWMKP